MRIVFHIVLALLTLFAVADGLRRIAPYPMDHKLGTKLRFFADDKDDYDLVIVGSSRTVAGLIPKRIAAEMSARGVTMRAFNLAENAMTPHEADATLRKVLALRPARLRWVLAELEYWQGRLQPRAAFSHRTFLWHDAAATYAAIRSAFLFARRPDQKWQRALGHFLHFSGYAVALGRGPEVVTTLRSYASGVHRPQWLVDDQGYLEPEWGSRIVDVSDYFSRPCGAQKGDDQLAFYRQRLERLNARNRRPVELDELDLRAVDRREALLRRAGVVPIHFIPPRIEPVPHLLRLEERGVIEHLFAFNDPEAYPQLFAVENRWDCGHLKQSGAEMLSILLAERLVEVTSSPAG